jgi:hypothetical protein
MAQTARGPAQMGFEDLPDVHARRHAQRVEHDVDRRSIFKEGHVFRRQNAGDNPLIPVATGHLVARLQLALHRDEHLDHLEHARCQIIAAFQLVDAIFILRVDRLHRVVILALDGFQIGLDLVVLDRDLPPFMRSTSARAASSMTAPFFIDSVQPSQSDRCSMSFRRDHVARLRMVRSSSRSLPRRSFSSPEWRGSIVHVDAVTVEHAHINDRARNARRQAQRGVTHVSSPFHQRSRAAAFLPASSGFHPWA